MSEMTTTSFDTGSPADHFGPQFGPEHLAALSPGLSDQQQALNSQSPRKLLPSSSGNGMSQSQYTQTLGGQLKVGNSMAADQYEQARFNPGSIL